VDGARHRHGDRRARQLPPEPHRRLALVACIKCGVCVIFCPEGCIGWTQAGYPDGNLEYCKGCGICVRECWTTCIRMKEEEV
jgi:2-oxoacid:acceptor oxidoreductase delta subunit (pyruvate/2-ketoisovalerate family)